MPDLATLTHRADGRGGRRNQCPSKGRFKRASLAILETAFDWISARNAVHGFRLTWAPDSKLDFAGSIEPRICPSP